jgi:hypothetical protein
MTEQARALTLLACAVALVAAGCSGRPTLNLHTPHTAVIETGELAIDRIYRSMTGPADRTPVDFSDLDWVTAYRTSVIDAESGEPMGDEFFCHSQLQMQNGTRLLVTATGADEIRFPDGFGMRVNQIMKGVGAEQRRLSFLGMVLNNHVPDIHRRMKVRATIEYFTDEDLGTPARLKKLYKVGMTLEVEPLSKHTAPADQPVNSDVSTHCALVGEAPSHWLVPPGPQTTRKRYANVVPVDATVHYAVVHLHNFARYFRLTDATTGKILWQTDVVYEPERVQIAKIPVYSSAEGFRMYKEHAYEIEAFYDNTTDEDIDAMAQIDLYFHPDGDVDITYPTGPW